MRRLIRHEEDLRTLIALSQCAVRQGSEMQLVERIRRVGNKLPQKDLVIRIDGMNHQVEKLFCFCLKFMLYLCHEKISFT